MMITKNEEAFLQDALRSVSFCNDIVVVDDESKDSTREVAKTFGARVFQRKLDGFATQKNYGISKTKNDWVLVLDADERVSNELAEYLRAFTPENTAKAYRINFKNYLGQKWLKHGGLYPDPHIRLFDKKFAQYGAREVHEELEVDGKIGELDYDIIHLTYANYKEYLAKVKKYAGLEARWRETRPSAITPLKEFARRYFKLKGFKDGLAGFVSASLLGYYQYLLRKGR